MGAMETHSTVAHKKKHYLRPPRQWVQYQRHCSYLVVAAWSEGPRATLALLCGVY